jgi:hypothetical protein
MNNVVMVARKDTKTSGSKDTKSFWMRTLKVQKPFGYIKIKKILLRKPLDPNYKIHENTENLSNLSKGGNRPAISPPQTKLKLKSGGCQV